MGGRVERKLICIPCLSLLRVKKPSPPTSSTYHASIPGPASPICGACCGCVGGSIGGCIIRCNPMPTPSITASSTAQPIAEFRAAFTPPRTAREPPVMKPAITVCCQSLMLIPLLTPASPCRSRAPWTWLRYRSANILALYGSSFFRIPFTAQSKVLNRPPQTPKFPPKTGARAFMAVRAPIRRSP